MKFNYSKKNVYENSKYGIEFPDEFTLLKDFEQNALLADKTRDFIAYYGKIDMEALKNGQDNSAGIVIYSMDEVNMVETSYKKNQQLKQIIDELGFYASYKMFQAPVILKDTITKYGVADLNFGKVGFIHMISNNIHNYMFSFGQKNNYQKIRVEISLNLENEKSYDDLAISLMNKYYNIEDLDEVLMPNDQMFLADNINKSIIDKWVNNFKDIYLNIESHYEMIEKILSARSELEKEEMFEELNETLEYFDQDALTEKLYKRCLKFYSKYIDEWFKLCEKYLRCVEEFIEKAKTQNVSDKELIEGYRLIKQFIERNKEYTLGDEKITSDYIVELNRKLFTKNIIELINEINPQELTPLQKTNIRLKRKICDVLKISSTPMTAIQIQAEDYELGENSNQKISALLKQLIQEGKVTQYQDGKKIFFCINDNEK